MAAVQQNGLALDDVPRELRNETICMAAVQQNGHALYYVLEEQYTEAVCMAAIEVGGSGLQLGKRPCGAAADCEPAPKRVCAAVAQQCATSSQR